MNKILTEIQKRDLSGGLVKFVLFYSGKNGTNVELQTITAVIHVCQKNSSHGSLILLNKN